MKSTLTKLGLLTSSIVGGLTLATAPVMAQSGLNVTIQSTKGFAGDFGNVISTILTIVMAIAALIVFFFLIMGGIEWITSGGDKSKTENARNKITAAVIGLIILAASYAVLTIVLKVLGLTSITAAFENIKPFAPAGGSM